MMHHCYDDMMTKIKEGAFYTSWNYVVLYHKVSTYCKRLGSELTIFQSDCFSYVVVNGVTFHRIFRLVDPFVKVHILIIKLDRFFIYRDVLFVHFSPLFFSFSPPHVCTKIKFKVWQYFHSCSPAHYEVNENQVFVQYICLEGFLEWVLTKIILWYWTLDLSLNFF